MVETINKLIRVSRGLLQELGREPTAEEIAERMLITADKVREIVKVSQEPVSLETPIGEEEDSHLGDFIPDNQALAPSDAASHKLLKEQVESVLEGLTGRERRVLQLRFGLEDGRTRTLEEVGREFNVTRERIRQIEAKALRKLRHPSRSRKHKDYLEELIWEPPIGRLPSRSALRCAPALVAHDLRQRLPTARARIRPRILGRHWAADRDHRPGGPFRRDPEDPFRFGLLRVVAEPCRPAAEPERVRRDKEPLGHPALVVRLARPFAVEHDRDRERCAGEPVDVRPQLADALERVAVAHDHEVPGLRVLRASGPARDLEDLRDDVIGDGVGRVLADLSDGAERFDHAVEHMADARGTIPP